jgi:hypothetical protein
MDKSGYQPIWDGEKEVGIGWRDCNTRYEAIKRYLIARMGEQIPQMPTSPHVFDLGAYNGYFCRRLADDFQARCTAVDGQPFLADYESPSGGSVTAIRQLFTPTDIRQMPDQDIVLCLSVLHHWREWRDYLEALLLLGTVTFIETANPAENMNADAKAYAADTERMLHAYPSASILVETPPMNNHPNVLRKLWVIDPQRVVVDDDEAA